MKIKFFFLKSVFLFILIYLAATLHLAAAQDAVDELVVLATGIPTPVAQTGSTVDVISGAELRQLQIIYLQDALKLKGINVPQSGGPGTLSNVFLRGMPGKYTNLFVDGISMFDPRSNQVVWADVIIDGVRQVDILRGSQGVLYGSNAIAGVISQVTDTGGEASQTLRVEGGEMATQQLVLTGKGTIGSVMDATDYGTTDYGYAVSHSTTNGISAADEDKGNSEADGYDNQLVNLRLDRAISEQLTLILVARLARGEVNTDEGFPPSDALGKYEAFERYAARAGAAYAVGRWTHHVDTTGYLSEVDEYSNYRRDTEKKATRSTAAYRAIGRLDNGLNLVLGADYQSSTFTNKNKNDVDIAGAYTLVQFPFMEASTLTLAARHDDHELFGMQTSYRATIAHKRPSRTIWRAALGTGFRAPGLTELYLKKYGNRTLKPETSQSAEIGFDTALSPTVQLVATAFVVEIEDIIGYDANFVNQQITGTSKISGLELGTNWAVSEQFNMDVDAVYTDSKKPVGDGSGATAREVRVPRLQAGLTLNYQLNERTQLAANVHHVHGVIDFGAIRLEDYTLVGLRGSYQWRDAVKLYGRVENATDKNYQTVKGYGAPRRGVYIGVQKQL